MTKLFKGFKKDISMDIIVYDDVALYNLFNVIKFMKLKTEAHKLDSFKYVVKINTTKKLYNKLKNVLMIRGYLLKECGLVDKMVKIEL